MIQQITPSKIRAQYNGKSISIEVEALLPGYSSPNFVIYLNSIVGWESPDDCLEFTDEDRKVVVEGLKHDLTDRKVTFEFE